MARGAIAAGHELTARAGAAALEARRHRGGRGGGGGRDVVGGRAGADRAVRRRLRDGAAGARAGRRCWTRSRPSPAAICRRDGGWSRSSRCWCRSTSGRRRSSTSGRRPARCRAWWRGCTRRTAGTAGCPGARWCCRRPRRRREGVATNAGQSGGVRRDPGDPDPHAGGRGDLRARAAGTSRVGDEIVQQRAGRQHRAAGRATAPTCCTAAGWRGRWSTTRTGTAAG